MDCRRYPDFQQKKLKNLVVAHYRKLYDVEVDPEWIVWVPSVMPGVTLSVKIRQGSFTYFVPMYNHIREVTLEAKQPVTEVPMKKRDLIAVICPCINGPVSEIIRGISSQAMTCNTDTAVFSAAGPVFPSGPECIWRIPHPSPDPPRRTGQKW